MCARISMSSDDETFDDLPEEELSEEDALEAVSYTHLTLPTTVFV